MQHLNHKLFTNIPSWEIFKNNLEKEFKYDYSKIGFCFEIFAKYYFLFNDTIRRDFKNVWLYREIPLSIKSKLNLTNSDYGIDLILEDFDGKYYAVQCKYKKNENSSLYWSKDKISNLFAYSNKVDYYIVFSNASKIDDVSKTRTNNFGFINISDLLKLDNNFFSQISEFITKNNKPKEIKFTPKEHQQQAINQALSFYQKNNRGQLILPCGTGKTLTALWIKENLNSNNTIVLLPSLALLKQIKDDWKTHSKEHLNYICVCSDTDVDKDDSEIKTFEIDLKVSTNPDEILEFISNTSNNIIFSTYQSVDKIISAVENTDFIFDLLICDEAHRTAGVGKSNFTIIHDNYKLPVDKRLYMTATPKVASTNLKNKAKQDDDIYLYDMSNRDIFGDEFYRMSFKYAIDKKLLVDYKILAIGISDEEIQEYIKKRKYVNSKLSVDELANSYALNFVMDKYDLSHSITFHHRVKTAKEFTKINKDLFNNLNSFHVNGKLNSVKKAQILNEFRNSEKATISNARCLTEGVDIPNIDLVYFSDTKNSKIDIVQASGRALRTHNTKRLGYIVVPIFHSKKDTLYSDIKNSTFNNLIQVIKSMCDQDERLQEEINTLAYEKTSKKSNILNFDDINSNIVSLENFNSSDLKKELFDQIIEKNSNNWDLKFIELKEWLTSNSLPSKEENLDLYRWVATQRVKYNKKTLEQDKINKLNSISFIWDVHEFNWNKKFELLKKWKAKHPEITRWPSQRSNEPVEHELAVWFLKIRKSYKDASIKETHFNKLVEINFPFDPNLYKWNAIYNKFEIFLEKNKRWPNIEDRQERILYNWFIRNNGKNLNKVQKDLYNKLIEKKDEFNDNSLGILEGSFNKIESFIKENGRLPNSTALKCKNNEERNLYSWMLLRREDFHNNKLTNKQLTKLCDLGLEAFLINKQERRKSESFDEILSQIQQFYLKNGKWPSYGKNKDPIENRLAQWINSQTNRFRGNLKGYSIYSEENYKKLKDIGYDLAINKRKDTFDIYLKKLEDFYLEHNHWPRYSDKYSKEEYKLAKWLSYIKQAKKGQISKKLTKEEELKLSSIGYHLDDKLHSYDEVWNNKYNKVLNILESEGEISYLKYKNLYHWVNNQKYKLNNNKLSNDKVDKLERIISKLS